MVAGGGGKAISGRVCSGSSETRFSSKANSELSSHQKKIFKVDHLIGVAIAGITADGRVISSSLIKLRFVLNGPGSDLMALACLLVGWTNLAFTSITIALVVTTLNTKLLPLDLGHKLQKHTWNNRSQGS